MYLNHKQSMKEVLRHVAVRIHLMNLLYRLRHRRGYITAHMDQPTTVARFSSVYRLKVWVHSSDQTAVSGLGSEMAATQVLRDELVPLLARLDCRTLLDVGCGDWSWMQSLELPCAYQGVDIVPEVIAANQRHRRPGVGFAVADATTDLLPTADVALCREMLFHLSFADGLAVLGNIRASSARWLIATTDTSIWFNSDIQSGDFRMINLCRSPYRLPPPHFIIDDGAVAKGRVLGVWPTADLPTERRR